MDKQRYVVLRTSGEGTRVLSGTRSAAAETLRNVEIAVETASLTPKEANETRRDPSVLRSAPVMPIMLMQPKVIEVAEAAEQENATWGVAAVGALQSPFTGAGVTVAVLDTGIDADHDAFRGKTIVQKDFTGEGDGDRNGHGTHCAGTVFGGEVKGLRIGIAPGVEKAFIGKVLDEEGGGTTEQILDGILWAVRAGAQVISMSIGFDFPGMVRELIEKEGLEIEPATSQALSAYRENVRLFDALADLVRAHSSMFANTVVAAAAGNESNRPKYQIAVAPPAAADGFLSVGALQKYSGADLRVGIADFSNAGPVVSAPGVGIKSARLGGGLIAMNGTSMATPHVAGVAALWLEQIRSANPKAHIRQLEGRLIGTATLDHLAAGEDPSNAGAGLVQAPKR